MLSYLLRRLVYMVISFWVLSIVAFVIIQLPPGDFLSSYIAKLHQSGTPTSEGQLEVAKKYYGLDAPLTTQYFLWVGRFVRGDLGRSFEWEQPVEKLLKERLPFTLILALFTLIFTYVVAIPIGIYSATHQYTIADYIFSVTGFAGLAVPNFMFALILMVFAFRYFGISVGGLFSSEYLSAPWSIARVWDLLSHLWIPIIVIGTAGTAGLVRVMRGCLLDELRKQYVITARAKGVAERNLLFKYPVRVAINPIISTIGWTLPRIISGGTITAIVLGLPTTGPLLYKALISQDMFMASSIVAILGILTVIGTFLSDILLIVFDPRIRFGKKV